MKDQTIKRRKRVSVEGRGGEITGPPPSPSSSILHPSLWRSHDKCHLHNRAASKNTPVERLMRHTGPLQRDASGGLFMSDVCEGSETDLHKHLSEILFCPQVVSCVLALWLRPAAHQPAAAKRDPVPLLFSISFPSLLLQERMGGEKRRPCQGP